MVTKVQPRAPAAPKSLSSPVGQSPEVPPPSSAPAAASDQFGVIGTDSTKPALSPAQARSASRAVNDTLQFTALVATLEARAPALAKRALDALVAAESSLTGWAQATSEELRALIRAEGLRLWRAEHAPQTHDAPNDGKLIGARGKVYERDTPLSDVEPVLPSNGKPPLRTVVYVNGIAVDAAFQQKHAQELADTMQCAVVGVHNATNGQKSDILQAIADKFNRGDNPAADTVLRLVNGALKAGQPIELVGHSQGALIVSNALARASQILDRLALSPDEKRLALSLVRVQTFGGAARSYPDGPVYEHNFNTADLVPMLTGLGASLGFNVHFGAGAKVNRFFDNHWSLLRNHSFRNVYLKRRFPEATAALPK